MPRLSLYSRSAISSISAAAFPSKPAPDGTMAEPGFGVLGLELDAAVELGRRFGQAAIYRWTADALAIVGVDDTRQVEMGWSVVRLAGS